MARRIRFSVCLHLFPCLDFLLAFVLVPYHPLERPSTLSFSTFHLSLPSLTRRSLFDSNSPTVTRIQFYAYEIARNRLGLNEKAHEIAKVEAEKERVKKEKEAKQKEKAAKKARA